MQPIPHLTRRIQVTWNCPDHSRCPPAAARRRLSPSSFSSTTLRTRTMSDSHSPVYALSQFQFLIVTVIERNISLLINQMSFLLLLQLSKEWRWKVPRTLFVFPFNFIVIARQHLVCLLQGRPGNLEWFTHSEPSVNYTLTILGRPPSCHTSVQRNPTC